MMHTKFQDHRPFGFREEDFLKFLPYMDMVAILVMWHNHHSILFFHSYIPCNVASVGLAVSKDKEVWK